MRRVAFSARAEADLEGIADDFAADNPRRAVSPIHEPRARCGASERHPRAVRLREEFGSGVRVTGHRPCLVLYTVWEDGTVRIERVVRGARDLGHLVES
jgi:toxin ParE1/3/4